MNKTPKLRFKEFSGDWENKKLGSLLEFKNGINASKEQYGHGKKFINVLDILSNDYITYENIIGKVDVDDATFDKYSVGYGDVVFQRSSETREEVGTANVYLDKDNKATFGGFIIRGKKIGEYDPIFMNKLLKSSTSRKEITTKSGGSTRYNVGQETLSEVSLLFPKLEEQEKIASFFSLIDDKISIQGEKLEMLKDYKTGMMQKIFSRELRFKDDEGRDYPEWEEKKIKDMELYISDGNYGEAYPTSSDMVEYGVPFLRGNNINSGYLNFNDMKYITPEKHSELLSGHIKSGDIIITVRGDLGKVGFATQEYEGSNMNAQLALIRVQYENLNARYIHQYMNTTEFYKEVLKRQTGTALKQLPIGKLKDISLKLPIVEEQKKIASILCTIDFKLKREEHKLDSLIEYKKGLLQHMFV
ncbi:MAG: restriction endonuclease subunit S [Paraclostridium sp.]